MKILSVDDNFIYIKEDKEIIVKNIKDEAKDLGVSPQSYVNIMYQREAYDNNARGYERMR